MSEEQGNTDVREPIDKQGLDKEKNFDGTSYRDKIATVDEEGKRKWIFAKKPSGKFYRARTWLSWFLLAFLFITPFIKIGGEPLLLFNILERKFVLFGIVFWPQDFHLFVLMTITLVVFIFLFTAVYGRIFCGWFCPQTIFMEMVFRKIEFFIEGDANKQRRLTKMPWTAEKVFKKSTKQTIFFAISFFIGNIFLSYIIGMDELLKLVSEPVSAHTGGFVAMLAFTGAFYFVFSWFREQACTLVCPYGRLQSVLLDDNSVVISYDFERGEMRERHSKQRSEQAGDCVDCRQCVVVCPTGIDIRNGTQLECVNCTACIDACDSVMVQLDMPKGLIRYASYNSILTGTKKLLTGRVVAYSAVLTALVGILIVLLLSRNEIETTILRAPGSLYELKGDGEVTNLYTIRVVNKSSLDLPVTLKLLSHEGSITLAGGTLNVSANALAETAFFVGLAQSDLPTRKNPITIGIYSGDKLLEEFSTIFLAPGGP